MVFVHVQVYAPKHKCAESRGGHWVSYSTPLPYSFDKGAWNKADRQQASVTLLSPAPDSTWITVELFFLFFI